MRTSVPVLVALLACALVARADIADRLDQKAPDVACSKWWNGKPAKIAKLAERVVVVHFHDPTKLTSKAFESKLGEFHARWKERPFTLIEVLVDCTEADADDYLERSGATWHVGHDGKSQSAMRYAGSSVPRTYLIGPDGVVAFHAHLAALTESLIEAQFTRARWWDEKAWPREVRPLLKAAREQRFGAALEHATALEEKEPPAVRELVAEVRAEVTRYFRFQKRVVTALRKDLDWAIVQRRVARMRQIYKGTDHAKEVEDWWRKLEANPRVAYVAAAQKRLEAILEKTNPAKKRDVEAALRELREVIHSWASTKPAERAEEWIRVFEKRLEDGSAR